MEKRPPIYDLESLRLSRLAEEDETVSLSEALAFADEDDEV